ncbi:MAG: hypothetical protein GXP25_16395 [Planctomycetes bacterium]|nr:hypothetical protein [Planctomycetota bacterium]
MKTMRLLLLGMVVSFAAAPLGRAQDTDGDGIPNTIEQDLGTNPDYAEKLDLVYDDKAKDEGDKSISKDNYLPSHDITKVYFGNIAGNRFMWRIEFLKPIDKDQLSFIIYLDADNNPKNGRKDMPGVDFMFHTTSTSVFAPDGSRTSDGKTRVWIDGNRLTFVRDVDLHQEGGKSVFNMRLLCETRKPHKFVDSTPKIEVKGQGMSDRKKMPTLADITENQNVEGLYGLDRIRKIKADKDNIHIRIGDTDMDGYMYDIFTEYKESSARMTRTKGSVSFTVPKAGKYYPAFLTYDDFGDEKFTLSIDGVRKGIAVATNENRRTWLFWLTQPIEFKGGEVVTITAIGPTGAHRLEDLFLLKNKPKPRSREFTFSEIHADPIFEGKDVSARVTWISSWSTPSVAEYGTDATYGKVADMDVPAAKKPACNHRVYVHNLEEGKTYHFRVVGVDPKGNRIESKDFTFATTRPAPFIGNVKHGQLALTFKNDLDVDYVSWPVTSGIPFPKGALGSDENIRVLDPKGAEVPLQTKVLARWPDRSIKWVLLDFQANVPKGGESIYTMEYGTEVKRAEPKTPLMVEEGQDTITVVTGPVKLVLNKKKFDFLGKVWLDQNGDGKFTNNELVSQGGDKAGIFLTADDGTVYSSLSPPDEVVVEEAGPCRATIKIAGTHKAQGKDLFRYIVRINAYAGLPHLRVFHTWENNHIAENFTKITNLFLSTPLAGGVQHCAMGGDEKAITGDPGKGDIRLFQNFDDKYTVTTGTAETTKGKRAAGWATASDGKKGVTTAVRWFWQLYPKDFIIDKSGIRVGICPTLGKEDYAEFPFEGEQHYLYYYLLNGRYKLKQGCSKRHELLYYFHKGDAQSADAARHAKCFEKPLVAVAPAKWYCDSKAFYDVWPKDMKRFKAYEIGIENSLKVYLLRREMVKEYGMLNFGDWYGERRVNWGNIEYDTQHGMCLHFIRSGILDFFYTGQQAQQHNQDVDTVRYYSDPRRVGGVWAHCMGHVGEYYKIPAAPPGTPRGGMSVTHTWCEGHMDYYYLTGDPRALKAAKMIADHYDWQYTKEYDFTNGRTAGWHLILTLGVYNGTYDPYYLNAAKIIVARVAERQRPDGGWRRQLVPGHCFDIPRHHGNAMFMIGILLDGLKYYHGFTHDPKVAKMIVEGAEYIIRETWENDPKYYCFRYTSCPNSSKGHGVTMAYCHPFTYAYRLSQKEIFKDVVMKGASISVSRSLYGKGFSSAYRTGPRALYDIALWGGTFLPAPPPKFIEPTWYKKAVIIQAEDFTGQGGGQVQFKTDRPTTVGKMITYWHANLGHWLEWKAKVPKTGKYSIVFRYATNCKNTQRDLKIDGTYPHPACKVIRFKSTGGFGVKADQWQYLTVSDEKGKPVLFDLSAGEHTIWMSNLNDGLGVDFIALVPEK